jgi:hypothetical protein
MPKDYRAGQAKLIDAGGSIQPSAQALVRDPIDRGSSSFARAA